MPVFFLSACDKKYFGHLRNLSWSSAIVAAPAGGQQTCVSYVGADRLCGGGAAVLCQTILKSKPWRSRPMKWPMCRTIPVLPGKCSR